MNLDTCIVCGSSENLNTSMTIDVDGEKFTVNICDTDADTATPKLVKDHFLSKKSEIDDIIAKARALGLEVNIPTAPGKIVTVQAPEAVMLGAPVPADPAAIIYTDPTIQLLDSAIASAIEGSEKDGILPTGVVDSKAQRVQGVSGAGTESHSAYIPGSGEDRLDPTLLEGKVKMVGGQGRGGQPIAIPSIRVDQTGTTTVRVRQDVDDTALQRRFKSMANEPSGGYSVHNCPICKGDGVIKQRGQLDTCPKCHGTGLLNN